MPERKDAAEARHDATREAYSLMGAMTEITAFLSSFMLLLATPAIDIIDDWVVYSFLPSIPEVPEVEEEEGEPGRARPPAEKLRLVAVRYPSQLEVADDEIVATVLRRAKAREAYVESEREREKAANLEKEEADRELRRLVSERLDDLVEQAAAQEAIRPELVDYLRRPRREPIRNFGTVTADFWEDTKSELSELKRGDRRVDVVERTPYVGEGEFRLVMLYSVKEDDVDRRIFLEGIIAKIRERDSHEQPTTAQASQEGGSTD